MFSKLQQMMIGLNLRANEHGHTKQLRQVVLGSAALARKPDDFEATLNGIAEAARFHESEAASWLVNEDIASGRAGAFDACDLGAWLIIAEQAGVAAVPAKPILHLDEDEVEIASGTVDLGNAPVMRRARTLVSRAIGAPKGDAADSGTVMHRDPQAVMDKLSDAMDAVPDGWMVRPQHCGHSELKALAGAGLAGRTSPEVLFGADLEIGPGWVRNGNRRRINLQDRRVLELHAQGPHRGMTIYARPWIQAARYVEGEDPHRAGTAFAGRGLWPLECRVFVRAGQVEGISAYYGFVGEVSTENARVALAVRDEAQKIVDLLSRRHLIPRSMAVEHARRNSAMSGVLDANGYGRDDISCTLDFLETPAGLMLLEAGPGNSPVGGGHPCCFAGCGGKPAHGAIIQTQGVAFRPMSHVIVADPSTWSEGDRTDAILSWSEVEILASG